MLSGGAGGLGEGCGMGMVVGGGGGGGVIEGGRGAMDVDALGEKFGVVSTDEDKSSGGGGWGGGEECECGDDVGGVSAATVASDAFHVVEDEESGGVGVEEGL